MFVSFVLRLHSLARHTAEEGVIGGEEGKVGHDPLEWEAKTPRPAMTLKSVSAAKNGLESRAIRWQGWSIQADSPGMRGVASLKVGHGASTRQLGGGEGAVSSCLGGGCGATLVIPEGALPQRSWNGCDTYASR